MHRGWERNVDYIVRHEAMQKRFWTISGYIYVFLCGFLDVFSDKSSDPVDENRGEVWDSCLITGLVLG